MCCLYYTLATFLGRNRGTIVEHVHTTRERSFRIGGRGCCSGVGSLTAVAPRLIIRSASGTRPASTAAARSRSMIGAIRSSGRLPETKPCPRERCVAPFTRNIPRSVMAGEIAAVVLALRAMPAGGGTGRCIRPRVASTLRRGNRGIRQIGYLCPGRGLRRHVLVT